MSQSPLPPDLASELLRQQKELLTAQQEFIRLQQTALSVRAEHQTAAHSLVSPSVESAAGTFDVGAEILAEEGVGPVGESVPESAPDAPFERGTSTGTGTGRRGITFLLPGVLGVLVLALLFRSPEELDDLRMQMNQMRAKHLEELGRANSELLQVQEQLRFNQQALLQTEQALLETQAAVTESVPVLSSTAQIAAIAPTAQAARVPAAVLSVGAREEQARSQLLQLASTLHQNGSELRRNLLEYRETYRALAETRLEIAKLKSKPGDAAPVIGDFIPPDVAQLMMDEKLGISSEAFVPAREWLSLDLIELGVVMREKDAELRTGQRKLTAVQNDIRRTQAELVAAQEELKVLVR